MTAKPDIAEVLTDDNTAPVFIAGCGRSGTTYLKTLVDAHPDIFIPTESLFIADYIAHGRCLPMGLCQLLFFNEPQLRVWYRGPAFEGTSPLCLVKGVHERAATAAGARRWGQKTPRFVRYMELFDAAFPEARWILVHRDPRAVVSSMLRSRRHTYSVRCACRRWNRDNAALLQGMSQRAERVLCIAFEDLVADPVPILDRVWDFLSMPAVPLEDLLRNARVRPLLGSGFVVNTVRDGLSNDPAKTNSWRGHLQPAQQAYIESACATLMARLGYAREIKDEPKQDRPPGDAFQALRDIGIFYEYLRHWPRYLLHTTLRRITLRAACLVRLGRAGR